ncbi:elongator complex protein 5 [Lampris incognitus]|uniref:elongator complex protein 5 n=1 Tax=Lampris incognitus TaxID=2546036 RepID=UPI0024B61448|nr:elongator complex protein 5 [Lampris incognitus]
MLLELVQGAEAGGFIVIQDCTSYSGRHLLKSFISAALNREEDVHVLGFEVSEEELKDGLIGSCLQRLHFHDAYVDPLGWMGHSPFTVHQFNAEELTNLLKKLPQPKPVTLVIDSLSWILRHVSPPAVCKSLQQLKKGVAVRTMIGLLHSDLHQHGIVGSICHLASSVITLTPGDRGLEAVAKMTRRSKSGKIVQDEEIFSLKEDLTITIQGKPSHPRTTQPDPDELEVDPAANLTFNLRLSNTEREAKEKLALPFVFSQEKKSALLQSGPGSGRIMYEPDANDDYDQEDPDDDLDV